MSEPKEMKLTFEQRQKVNDVLEKSIENPDQVAHDYVVKCKEVERLTKRVEELEGLLRSAWKWVQNERLYEAIDQALQGGRDEV